MADNAPRGQALIMALLLVDDPLFDSHENPALHPERPERLEACRRGLASGLLQPPATIAGSNASPEDLLLAHHPAYVDILLAARGKHGAFDADTYHNERSVDVALAAAGGALALTEAAWQHRGRGLALLRPPGHHARPGGAMGFCLINHVALAARRALRLGAERVAIIDWDVHHGNGTEEIFYEDPSVLYISLHQHPHYPGTGLHTDTGAKDGRGLTVNLPLSAHATEAVYLEAFRTIVLPVLSEFAPNLLLVSTGYDAHFRDPLGSMSLTDSTYHALTRMLLTSLNVPVVMVLEGGYDLEALEGCVAATARALDAEPGGIDTAWSDPSPSSVSRSHLEQLNTLRRWHAKFWRSL